MLDFTEAMSIAILLPMILGLAVVAIITVLILVLVKSSQKNTSTPMQSTFYMPQQNNMNPQQYATTLKFCPHCGKSIENPNHQFCPNCGNRF